MLVSKSKYNQELMLLKIETENLKDMDDFERVFQENIVKIEEAGHEIVKKTAESQIAAFGRTGYILYIG